MSHDYKPSTRTPVAIDETKCCAAVWSANSWASYQCSRPRGFGPDKRYCRQHDPIAIKEKDDKRRAAYEAKWKEEENQRRKKERDAADLAKWRDFRNQIAEYRFKSDEDRNVIMSMLKNRHL